MKPSVTHFVKEKKTVLHDIELQSRFNNLPNDEYCLIKYYTYFVISLF